MYDEIHNPEKSYCHACTQEHYYTDITKEKLKIYSCNINKFKQAYDFYKKIKLEDHTASQEYLDLMDQCNNKTGFGSFSKNQKFERNKNLYSKLQKIKKDIDTKYGKLNKIIKKHIRKDDIGFNANECLDKYKISKIAKIHEIMKDFGITEDDFSKEENLIYYPSARSDTKLFKCLAKFRFDTDGRVSRINNKFINKKISNSNKFDESLFNTIFKDYICKGESKQKLVKNSMKDLVKYLITKKSAKKIEYQGMLFCGIAGVGKSLAVKKTLQFLKLYDLDSEIIFIDEGNFLDKDKLNLQYICNLCLNYLSCEGFPIITSNLKKEYILNAINSLQYNELEKYYKNNYKTIKINSNKTRKANEAILEDGDYNPEDLEEGFKTLKSLFSQNKQSLKTIEFDESDDQYRQGGDFSKSQFSSLLFEISMLRLRKTEGKIFVGPSDILTKGYWWGENYYSFNKKNKFIKCAKQWYTNSEYKTKGKLIIINNYKIFFQEPSDKLIQHIKNVIDAGHSIYINIGKDKGKDMKKIKEQIQEIEDNLQLKIKKNPLLLGHHSRLKNVIYCKSIAE